MIEENLLSQAVTAEWFINFLFQALLILTAGGAAMVMLKRKAAPLRSGIGVALIVLLALLPFFSAMFTVLDLPSYRTLLPFGEEGSVNPGEAEKPGDTGLPAITETGTLPAGGTDAQDTTQPDTGFAPGAWLSSPGVVNALNVAGLIWFSVFLFLFVRIIYGVFRVKRFKKDLLGIDDSRGRLVEILEQAREAFPGIKLPGIYTSPAITGPMVLGFFKPVLAIPHLLYETLSDSELKSILFHELSHIYHKDPMMGFLQRLATALHWWNPLVYRLSTYISQAREDICDNYAMMANNSRRYAECLINLAEKSALISRIPLAIGMAAPHIPLKERITQILSKERIMDTKLKRSTLISIGIIVLVLTAFVMGHTWTLTPEEEGQPDKLTRQLTFLADHIAAKETPAAMMVALKDILHEQIIFTELRFEGEKLFIDGSAPSMKLVDTLIQRLPMAGFSDVKLLASGDGDTGALECTFSVSAKYEPEGDDPGKEEDSGKDPQAIKALIEKMETGVSSLREAALLMRKVQSVFRESGLRPIRWTTLGDRKNINGYNTMPISIELSGTYHGFTEFFKAVSQLEKLTWIESIKFRQDTGAKVSQKYSQIAAFTFNILMKTKK